jgi:hypothetical protein
MRIALLLKSRKQQMSEDYLERAVVFNLEKGRVVGVENETLDSEDVNSLTSWAQTKKVKEIYAPYVDEQLRLYLGKTGISVKGYDELSENRLFRTFIFS